MAAYVDPGYRGIQEVRYGGSGTLRCWPDVDGATTDPSSATVSIYYPFQGSPNSTPLVSGAAVTEAASHLLTYTLNASDTATYVLQEGWRAEFTFVVSGVTYVRTVVFDIVRQPIVDAIPIRVDDLKRAHVAIAQALSQQSVETTAHQYFIMPAWQDVLDYVRSSGNRPNCISPAETLRSLVLNAALRNVCNAFTRAPEDLYWNLGIKYQAEFDRAKKETALRYDPSDTFAHAEDRSWSTPDLLFGADLSITNAMNWRGGRRARGY